ncbi:MAG: primosomal protein N' [Candidatus Raymondbacteria bacterium RifOxyA12_full_50_37]|nr:MAG: primosomal protein N' [Candidatus Raymondbacteria bacterium RifOxyA12_full_50_37]
MVVSIIFPVSAPGRYAYAVAVEHCPMIFPGIRVQAQLGETLRWGFVCEILEQAPVERLKTVCAVGSPAHSFSPTYMRFLLWLADYYCAFSGDVLRTALPRAIERAFDKAVVSYAAHKDTRDPPMPPGPLTGEQQQAFAAIAAACDSGGHATFLVQGVTGSGKSHIYYHCAHHALEQGKAALVMVPEISLTPQTVSMFTGIFGNEVAVFHSGMTEKERIANWFSVLAGIKRIVIGVRSVIFAPIPRLGLVIVDEEHDSSYAQDEKSFNFNARDAIIMRAKLEGAVVVLGSATPSLESRYNCQLGKYRLLTLARRYNDQSLPRVTLVDMRTERKENNWSLFSRALQEKIACKLERSEQVILLKNRRGFANFLQCGECGHVPLCGQCSVSLTYHKSIGRMVCHYCDSRTLPPETCPSCGGHRLKPAGAGVERVEEELRKLFPGITAVRLDHDAASRANKVGDILETFRSGRAQVLIGTQMVSKGLDFHKVTLVGVILADTGLFMPDFHSSERNFQLLTQVAGRSGRGSSAGEVVLQTYAPDERSIQFAVAQDYDSYYRHELENRRELGFTPFSRGVLVKFLDKTEKRSREAAFYFARAIEGKEGVDVLGPSPAPLFKIRNMFRHFMYIKGRDSVLLHAAVAEGFARFRASSFRKVKVRVAFDPDSLL